jgi:hypothetical protein
MIISVSLIISAIPPRSAMSLLSSSFSSSKVSSCLTYSYFFLKCLLFCNRLEASSTCRCPPPNNQCPHTLRNLSFQGGRRSVVRCAKVLCKEYSLHFGPDGNNFPDGGCFRWFPTGSGCGRDMLYSITVLHPWKPKGTYCDFIVGHFR